MRRSDILSAVAVASSVLLLICGKLIPLQINSSTKDVLNDSGRNVNNSQITRTVVRKIINFHLENCNSILSSSLEDEMFIAVENMSFSPPLQRLLQDYYSLLKYCNSPPNE